MRSTNYLQQYKKLAKVLRILAQAGYLISAVLFVTLLPLAVYMSITRGYAISIGISEKFYLGYVEWGVIRYNLAFAAAAITPQHTISIINQMLYTIVVYAAVSGGIFFYLSGVLKAVENGVPFERKNPRRIASMGIIFIVGAFFVGTAQASLAKIVILAMGLTGALSVNYSANSSMLLAGFLLLILSSIFRYGSYLQEEYDATL